MEHLNKLKSFFYRPHDFAVGGKEDPYMLRWYIIPRNRIFNIYLHKFLKSDEPRSLHNHPWWSLSIMLRNKYIEHLSENRTIIRSAGSIVLRDPNWYHRIELIPNSKPVWTIFITGKRKQTWGFKCPQGFVEHTVFNDPKNPGEIGRGCD